MSAIAGMVGGATMVMLLAALVGAGAELVVFCMLLAEIAGGALAGRAAGRGYDRWLEAREQAEREAHMPVARLLKGGTSLGPVSK